PPSTSHSSTLSLHDALPIFSNLGVIGGTQFTPVIFYPQVAILGASEMTTRPVYQKETESFQPVVTLPLSLSYDHRLIDGAEGVRDRKSTRLNSSHVSISYAV